MTAGLQWDVRSLLAATAVSRTWRVALRGQLPGRLAVLRLDEPGAARLGLNRVAEPEVLKAAAAAGLGPACLLADPARGLLLTEWLPGRAWTAADLQEPAKLRRAAALLRRLHATPLAGPVVDLDAALARYARAATGATGVPGETGVPGATGGENVCFCHNDPTPGNFIESPAGELRLIDWEYAGLCHPGFDLAGLALGAGLNREQVAVLLTAYRGRPPTPDEAASHRHWEAFCHRLGVLWIAASGAVPEL